MKFYLLIYPLLLMQPIVNAQDKLFSYWGEMSNKAQIQALGDSIKKPLFITGNKIYIIGSACITRDLGGDVNDRNDDGDANDRLNDGGANNRKNAGATAERKKKGNNKNRNKDGDANDRDEGGDANDRDEDGDANDRDIAGAKTLGARCSRTKSGKVLLYTRQDLKSSGAEIYYNHHFFNNKYFKIKQL
jgi:hypothetical protein